MCVLGFGGYNIDKHSSSEQGASMQQREGVGTSKEQKKKR